MTFFTSEHEPLYDSCVESAECDICGTFIGYYVSVRNADRAVKAHKKQKLCKDILEGKIEWL